MAASTVQPPQRACACSPGCSSPPQLVPQRFPSVFSSRANFSNEPEAGSWLWRPAVTPSAQRHPSLASSLPPARFGTFSRPISVPLTPVPLPPSSSAATIHTGPPRNVPIVVAGQHSHTTEASDGILAEPAVIGPRLRGEGLPQPCTTRWADMDTFVK